MWPRPRATIAGASARAERDRRAQVDLEHHVDLLLRELGQHAAGGQRRVEHEHVDLERLARQALDLVAVAEIAGDGAAAPARRRAARSTSVRRPVRIRSAPRAANARAIAAPRPPVAPVISTLPLTKRTSPEQCRSNSLARIAAQTRCQLGKTATVAVNPCRKLRPPTGPISPAAKNPAAGIPPRSSCDGARVVVGHAEHLRGRGRCRRTAARRPARRPDSAVIRNAQRPAQILVRRARVAGVQADDLTRLDRRRRPRRRRSTVGAEHAAHQKVALLVLRLAPGRSRPRSAGRRRSASARGASARRSRSRSSPAPGARRAR